MIGLAVNNRALYIEMVSLGSLKTTTVEPMNVFRIALMKGSAKAIMVHNHPNGDLQPSDADRDLTDRLIQVGIILDIPVLDHMIISTRAYLSFLDLGIMDELLKSTKWVPQYELIERIRREEKKIREEAVKLARRKGEEKGKKAGIKIGEEQGKEIGREEGRIDKAIEMAKVMKDKCMPLNEIIEISGLS